MSNIGVGNLTVEVYDRNSVVKVKNALVQITGSALGNFRTPLSFSDSTGLHGFVKFKDIPLDTYRVEVSRRWFEPTIVQSVSVDIPGKDPVGNFVKPNNLAMIKYPKAKAYPMPNYVVRHIPKTTPHDRRPGTAMAPEYLTIHSTGNPTSTATGERNWLTNSTNNRTASYHIVVDDKDAIECLPFDEMAWHAGDGANGPGNTKSVGLEICESGNRKKTLENAIILSAKVLSDKGWDETRLRKHYDWPNRRGKRKECPRLFMSQQYRKESKQTWEWFLNEVKIQLQLVGLYYENC